MHEEKNTHKNTDNNTDISFPGVEQLIVKMAPKMSVPVDEEPGKLNVEECLKELSTPNRPSQEEQRQRIIAAVPPMLRKTTKDSEIHFQPRLVSLGPVHHDKPHLEPAWSVKLEAAKSFLRAREINSKPEFTNKKLLEEIEKKIPEWKKQYEEHERLSSKYVDKQLAIMFLVDGCALLHFIDLQHQGKKFEISGVNKHHVAIAYQDMFLLENQLPFQLLELLMEHLHWAEGRIKIEEFIQRQILTSPRKDTKEAATSTTTPQAQAGDEALQVQPTHLLELLRKRYVIQHDLIRSPQTVNEGIKTATLGVRWDRVCNWWDRVFSSCWKPKSPDWLSFRRAVELRQRGIVFKPSESNLLVDVQLKPHPFLFFKKVLLLPPIILDDSSKAKFLNLIADEMSSADPNESEIINYLCFLDILVDEAEDVKVLREANIIQNMLGSDQEAADLFNEITKDLLISPSVIERVKQDLERHCSTSVFIWMAEFFHQHFSSPWTAIAFFGLLVGLCLTMVQTHFTVNPPSQQCDGLCKFLEKGIPKMKIN